MRVVTEKNIVEQTRTIRIEVADRELLDGPAATFLKGVQDLYERYEEALENQRMMEEASR